MELERSTEYARFVGMALHQRMGRLYWSDSRSIKSANLDGSEPKIVVGALARVKWVGVNFGQTQSDVLELTVKGTKCASVLRWTPETVECLVGLPQRYPSSPSAAAEFVRHEECSIRTTGGAMQGFAPNYGEMRASGYASPIVERIELSTSSISPHALAVQDHSLFGPDRAEEWLFWSNSGDGKIYRSSLLTTRIEIVHENAWSVRGLAVGSIRASESSPSLYFSLESKGTISRIQISASSVPRTPQVLLTDLDSPRGVAIDARSKILYFTEKTGRIYKAKMLGDSDAGIANAVAGDDKVGPLMTAHRVLTLSSITRLDGIAVDSKSVCSTCQVFRSRR